MQLRDLVIDVPDFPTPGVVFRDITPLLADAAALGHAVRAMAEPFRDDGVALVAGVESRGFILGGALAAALGAGFVPVRKRGRLPRSTVAVEYELEYGAAALEVHADSVIEGRRVLVADDVLATGGTAAATVLLMRRLHAEVVGCSFLIELAALGGRLRLNGVVARSVINYA